MKNFILISLLFCLHHLQGQIQCWEGTFSINIKDAGCLNGNDGSINIQSYLGYPFKYSLNGVPNATHAEYEVFFDKLTAGQYTVVTESVYEPICKDTMYITIGTDTLFNFNTQVLPPECTKPNTGAISIQANTAYDFLYSINNGQSFQTDSLFNHLPYGDFPLVVAAQNTTTTCKGIKTVLVQPYSFSVLVNATPSTCDGNNGTISAIPVGGYPPYQYQWLKDNQVVAIIQNPKNVSFGNYDLIVTDSRNCSASANIQVEVKATDIYIGNTSCHDTKDGFVSILPSVNQFQYTTNYIGQQHTKEPLHGDLDNDGDEDLYFIHYNTADSIWLNDGTGNFNNPDIGIGNGNTACVVIGNLIGDEHTEIIRIDEAGVITIYHTDNDLFGIIELPHLAAQSTDIAIGDLNNDGFKDIVIARKSGHLYLVNHQDTSFTAHSFENAFNNDNQVHLADINNNGFLDVLLFEDGANTFFLNDGNFSFQKKRDYSLSNRKKVDIGDVDNDGDVDIATFIYSNEATYRIWLNDGTGQFQKHSRDLKNKITSFDYGVTKLGDLNGDTHLDIIVSSWYSYRDTNNGITTFWLNDGEGNFRPTGYLGNNIKQADFLIQDFNGDLQADIFIANRNPKNLTTSVNNELWLYNKDYAAPTIEWEDGISTSLYRKNLDVGDYTALVIYQDGCMANIQTTVKSTVAMNIYRMYSSSTSCHDSKNAGITIQTEGGQSPYTYDLLDLQDSTTHFMNDGRIWSILGKGIHNLTITDGNNCELDTFFTIEGPPPIEVETSIGTVSNCEIANGQIELTPSGGNSKTDFSFLGIGKDFGRASAIKLADLDNDGDKDLIKLGYKRCEIWYNEGLGNFIFKEEIILKGSGGEIKAEDMDSDGDLDILIASSPFQFLRNHQGSFLVETYEYPANNAKIGDIDNDGDLDILHSINARPYLFINTGKAVFSEVTTPIDANYFDSEIALGDLDNDGDLDAISFTFNQLAIFENQSSNQFSTTYINDYDQPILVGGLLQLMDINNDGLLDIIHVSDYDNISFYINQGNLNFIYQEYKEPFYLGNNQPKEVQIIDINKDNFLDIFILTGGQNLLLLNNGEGDFTLHYPRIFKDTYTEYPTYIDFDDFDLDGDLDLFIGGSFLGIASNLSFGDTYAYKWNTTKSVSKVLDSLSSGIYEVTISDVKGCTATQKIEVFSNEPYISAQIINNCLEKDISGQITTTIEGGKNPYNYQWSNEETTAQITNLISGKYRLTVTDDDNCTAYFEGIVLKDCSLLIACENETGLIMPSNITINQLLIPTDTIVALSSITATGSIVKNQQVVFKAGQSILLKPGFLANTNSSFLAKIETCSEEAVSPKPIFSKRSTQKTINKNNTEIQIKPNPFITNLTIDLQVGKADLFHFVLMDLQGKIIQTSTKHFDNGKHTTTIKTSSLSAGMYLLQIWSKDFQASKKIIKIQ